MTLSEKLPHSENVWIFQANPKKYRIQEMLRDQEVIKEFHWRVNQYKKFIDKGEIGLIWLSGEKAGIYAVVNIISEPGYFQENEAEKKYWLDDAEEEGTQLRAKLTMIKNLVDSPIGKKTLKSIESLKDLSILKRPWAGTNFEVTLDEWSVIKELIEH